MIDIVVAMLQPTGHAIQMPVEIGEGSDHELLHESGAAQDAVCYQLHRDDEVKRRYDPQEGLSAGECIFRTVIHEQQQSPVPGEKVEQKKRNAQQPYQL